MKLGNYLQIVFAVNDPAAARDFYIKYGFKPVNDTILTDGSYNLRLVDAGGDRPSIQLHYAGSDLDAIATALTEAGATLNRNNPTASFTAPDAFPVSLTSQTVDVPMPPGDALNRSPISRFGKFGEFTIATSDLQASLAFWGKLGYDKLHESTDPYPWGIISDGMIVIGLHQNPDFNGQYIAYFSGDMIDRLTTLKDELPEFQAVPPEVDGKLGNAMFTAPGGQRFFLFYGEI
ncbi:MAG: hypothetical protein GYB67_18275 [Chloroflexi bacterium]|nr:hypothetical protein [Chloroflexota bacterium]